MRRPGLSRPSLGFVSVCSVYILAGTFFLWGFSVPDLDRVWTWYHGLKSGRIKSLSQQDRLQFMACMRRHTGLARTLLDNRALGLLSAHSDGWIATRTALVLRTPDSSHGSLKVELEVQTPKDLLPYTISLCGHGWQRELRVDRQGCLEVLLPQPPDFPELVELRINDRAFEKDPSMLGVRIGLEESP